MNDTKITVTVTETGQSLEVVVLSKRPEVIEVVFGQGIHNVRAELHPNRMGSAYVGKVMGREVVYARSQADVKAEQDKLNPNLKKSSRR
jgi:predicted RNase H-like nuclease